jgi:hypothetical protein
MQTTLERAVEKTLAFSPLETSQLSNAAQQAAGRFENEDVRKWRTGQDETANWILIIRRPEVRVLSRMA